jgi:aminoglycoside phosphotransferase (APT) family kinase protein
MAPPPLAGDAAVSALDASGAFAAFLQASAFRDDGQVTSIKFERVPGGASWETFIAFVGVRNEAHPRRFVVKRVPATGLLAPYDVRKEATVLQALEDTDVAAPRLLAWTEDRSILERPFAVMEFVDGESHDLSRIEQWSVWREAHSELGQEMLRMLARVQRVDCTTSGLLSVLGPRGDSAVRVMDVVERTINPLLDDSSGRGGREVVWWDASLWLKEHVPPVAERDLVLVHGDYRFGNFLWQDRRLVAVLDWERAMLGDPMTDLGFLCMPLSRLRRPDLMGMAMSFSDLAHVYEITTGRSIDIAVLHYYIIFWQFIQGCLAARQAARLCGHGEDPMGISSRPFVTPSIAARQTLLLIEQFEDGNHVL